MWHRKKQAQAAAREAMAAKIQASVDLAAAQATRKEVAEQADRLREINKKNHFSEGLSKSFQGRTA